MRWRWEETLASRCTMDTANTALQLPYCFNRDNPRYNLPLKTLHSCPRRLGNKLPSHSDIFKQTPTTSQNALEFTTTRFGLHPAKTPGPVSTGPGIGSAASWNPPSIVVRSSCVNKWWFRTGQPMDLVCRAEAKAHPISQANEDNSAETTRAQEKYCIWSSDRRSYTEAQVAIQLEGLFA